MFAPWTGFWELPTEKRLDGGSSLQVSQLYGSVDAKDEFLVAGLPINPDVSEGVSRSPNRQLCKAQRPQVSSQPRLISTGNTVP
jgi:hypothetical protein